MTPDTTVELYATPLDISNRYVIYADSREAAYAICQTWAKTVFTGCYWEREDFVFRCNGNINDLEQYNYCVFINHGRYNFAFITGYQYINDAMTQVSLQIDPWFNYAGEYDFDGTVCPIKRGHPSDGDASVMEMLTPEPVEIDHWQNGNGIVYSMNGFPTHFYLVSSVNADSFLDSTETVFEAIAKVFIGQGQDLGATFAGLNSNICDCETVVQLPTARLSDNLMRVIKSFIAAGQGNLLVDIYCIPPRFDSLNGQGESYNLAQLPVYRSGEGVIGTDFLRNPSRCPMKKIWYSDQFSHIHVEFFGQTRDYQLSEFSRAKILDGNFNFEICATNHQNGCPLIYWKDMINGESSSVIYGPTWQHVSFSTVAAVPGKTGENIVDLIDYVGSLAGAMYGANSIGGIFSGVAQGIKATDTLYKNVVERERGLTSNVGHSRSSDYANIVTNANIQITHVMPEQYSTLPRLLDFFGTYGYSQNGRPDTLSLSARQALYPKWCYIETSDCSLTGAEVPQGALSDVIRQFNQGTFIFWSAADFKDFSNAGTNWSS